jgi:RNA polymerase sigma-70 factor, ECF subfamily
MVMNNVRALSDRDSGPRSPEAGKARFAVRTAVDNSPETVWLVRHAVARAKQQDRDAIRFLYLTYADNVYSYVRTIVRDHYDAEDVTQHVFAKLMTSISKYENRRGPFRSWLMRIAHNAAVDVVRVRRETPVDEVIGPDERTRDHAEQDALALRDAISELPHAQREVVVMRYLLGLTPVEIADRTGRTHSSIYGLHHRGRRALCEQLRNLGSAPVTARPAALVA